jgi:hypothetical protein
MAANAAAYGTGADMDAAGLRKRAGGAPAYTLLPTEEDDKKKDVRRVGSPSANLPRGRRSQLNIGVCRRVE